MKLLIFLTDAIRTFKEKGEVKPRYYNPGNMFSEVHFVSPATEDLGPEALQCLVGEARMVVHPLGPLYGLWNLPPLRRVAALMQSVSPDVVRAYDPGLRGSVAVWTARRHGVPSVISVHADLDEQRRCERRALHQIRRLLERYALRNATAVLCVSRHVESYVKRYRTRPAIVIYNRVDTAQFVQRPAVARAGHVRILTVGRLVRQKYQACLIRALPSLDACLTLIGDGPLREPLQRLASRLGVDDRVEFIRSVPHVDIHRYYHNADLFAMATHYEGFCIPVLEAMAAGLPVVASRIGPIEELVGNAGLLVENRPAAFAEALARLVQDPRLRIEMGARARQRALTMDGNVMEWKERALYESVLGSQHPAMMLRRVDLPTAEPVA